MFACQIVFFNKMATLIVGTIALSFLYSTGFFLSLLLVAGPEGNYGDLVFIHDGMKQCFRAATSPDTEEDKNSELQDFEDSSLNS